MNTTYRFLSGIASSLLLAVGLERLAGRLDPLSFHTAALGSARGATADTTLPCFAESTADTTLPCFAESAADTTLPCFAEAQKS